MGDSEYITKEDILGNPKKGGAKRFIINTVILLLCIFISVILVVNITSIRKMAFSVKGKTELLSSSESDSIKAIQVKLEKTLDDLQKKSISFTPVEPYFIANMTVNEFWMYKNRELVLHGLCSTGSYTQLEAGNNKKWIFKTPRGSIENSGKENSAGLEKTRLGIY